MNKNRAVKKTATWIIVGIMISVFVLDILTVVLCNIYQKRYDLPYESFTYNYGDDRIHFLNTANSDAILIESNGHFALVDSGEGDNNPRRAMEYEGFEDEVRAYLKKVATASDGKVHLDFILGTHCHYDHIGAFESIIRDDDIIIEKAYFKEYTPWLVKGYESGKWANDVTYDEVIAALADRNIQRISELPTEQFTLGDFEIQFFNTVTSPDKAGEGENAASVGVKVTKNGKSAFLAADITQTTGLEKDLAPLIGDVELLKIGHHGYFGSCSQRFLRALKPELCIVTNQLGKIYPNIKWNITMVAHAPVYATVDCDGIIASFTDDGEIKLTTNIH
ncbi:MAG: MBL fold metallo-hydrolase [Clostridiales bacterium]|nr:MBL fold metallo-hydrolase [Clostridiales bacterium]